MPILWGAWRDDADSSGNTTVAGSPYTVTADAELGKRPSVVVVVRPWYNAGYVTLSSFSSWFTTIRNNGQIPLLNWAITSWSGTPAEGTITLSNIAIGNFDAAFLNGFADAIKALGYPVMILLGEEINLSGNAWYDSTGTSYIAMYKHVVDLFNSRGATNVSWCWDVNGIAPGGSITKWWPGNKVNGQPYVHWALMDVFNTSYTSGSTWITFDNIMDSDTTGQWGDTWDALTALDTTGLVRYGIGSFGSEDRTPTGTNNFAQSASWVTDAFGTQIPNGSGAARDYSKIELVMWFDQNEAQPALSDGVQHWNISGNPLGTNTARQAAFQGPNGPGANTHYVAGGQFILPAGMGKVYPYHAAHQESALSRAILHTSPAHLKGFWRLTETSGTSAADSSASGFSGTYTGGFTLGQQKIIPGALGPCVLFNGSTGYITVPNNAALSPSTTGKQTIMIVFQMNALPASGFATLAGKDGGTGYETAVRVLPSGAMDAHWWNPAGADYSSAAFGGFAPVGTPTMAFLTLDNTRSPVGRTAKGTIGGSLSFLNSTDTLANTPSAGTGTFDIGRRADNSQYANAFISHVAVWDLALSDVSMAELLQAANVRRDKPRGSVVG